MELSYSQCSSLALHVESIHADRSDPIEHIAALEELFGSSIYAHHIMNHTVQTNAITEAMTQLPADAIAKVVNSSYVYFDLHETLKSLLPHELLYARVLSSLAWTLDTNIVNNARGVVYDLYSEAMATGTIDSWAEFINALKEIEASEANAVLNGFEETGNFKVLVELLNQSKSWHDQAEAAADRAEIKYRKRSLEELLANEQPQRVDTFTRDNLATIAKHVAKGDTNRERITTEMLIRQRTNQAASQHEQRQKLQPAVLRVLHEAQRRCDNAGYDNEDIAFHTLPLAVQVRMIEATIRIIERTLTDLSGYRQITPIAFAGITAEGFDAMDHLKLVLKAPKYANATR